jgi:hypothetical protein
MNLSHRMGLETGSIGPSHENEILLLMLPGSPEVPHWWAPVMGAARTQKHGSNIFFS